MLINCSSFFAFLSLLFSSHSSWARDPFQAAPDLCSTIPFFLSLSASGAQEIPLIRACPNPSFFLKTVKDLTYSIEPNPQGKPTTQPVCCQPKSAGRQDFPSCPPLLSHPPFASELISHGPNMGCTTTQLCEPAPVVYTSISEEHQHSGWHPTVFPIFACSWDSCTV